MVTFNCCYCQVECADFRTLMKHYRFGHGTDPQFRINCYINGCAKNYSNVRTYKRHVRAKHEDFWTQHVQADGNPVNELIDDDIENDAEEEEAIHYEEVPFDATHEIASFLLNLRENYKIPQASCSFVANEFVDILEKCRESIGEDVRRVLQQSGVNIDELNDNGLREAFRETQFEQAFSLFSAQRNIEKYVAYQGHYVEPVEYILGRDNSTGKEDTMQYVPILKTLEAILKFDDVLGEIFEDHKHTSEGKLGDFCDSSNFKNNSLFSREPRSLQIQLYYDEFTTANPLGSHVQMLKFASVYFVLCNLKPMHRSKLRVIQLAILCPAMHVKKYTLDDVLLPLVDDLKKLEQHGVTIVKDGMEHTLRGTVCCLSADNLGAHEIGGFQLHFNHGRVCRECNVSKQNLKNHFRSDTLPRRTMEAYDQQAQAAKDNPGLARMYGIKGPSTLNQLEYFHVIGGLPADLAHDLFEGVIPEVLCEVIKDCVTKGYFTLHYLNERIKYFPYEGADKTNKPSQMSENVHTFSIRQTACQTWCLMRLLPLMVGHCVPRDSESWDVLLKLLDVTEYCTMTEVTPALVAFLADLIEDFLASYYTLFPNVSMKPKFHFIVHYPEQLLEYGPLVNLWTLRFEGKHNYFKELSRCTKNRKNLSRTLACRHEYMQASFRCGQGFLSHDSDKHSRGQMYPVVLLPSSIQRKVHTLVGPSGTVYTASKVQVNGTWYAVGLSVIAETSAEYHYKFAMIDNCFIIAGVAHFLCRFSVTTEYIKHVHAYHVQFGTCMSLLKADDFHNFYPLPVYQAGDMNLIPLRHYVPFEHKFLLIYGHNQKKVLVTAKSVQGASKTELLEVACATFGVQEENIIMQIWDEDFTDYADLEGEELVRGPLKIRITDKLQVILSAEQLKNGGEVDIVSCQAVEISENMDNCSETELSTLAGTSCSTPVAEPPASSSEAEDAALRSNNANKDDAVVQPSSKKMKSGGLITNFVLPKQPPTIEKKALLGGTTMSEGERGIFLENIYDAFVKHSENYYPSPTLYNSLCDAIFARYPRMAMPQPNMPVGSMRALWKNRLMYKFRNNRKRKDGHIPAIVEKKKPNPPRKSLTEKNVLPRWGMPYYLPDREPSEDDETIRVELRRQWVYIVPKVKPLEKSSPDPMAQDHVQWMCAEHRKRQPNYQRVLFALDKTLADRRAWIVNSVPKPRISDVRLKYPWLFDEDQLAAEVGRLQGSDILLEGQIRAGLKKYERALLLKGKARKRAHRSFTEALQDIVEQAGQQRKEEVTLKAAFLTIPGLLQENVDDIFVLPEAETTTAVHIKCDKETIGKTTEFLLSAEGEDIARSSSFFGAVAMYFSSFYVLNLAYPGSLHHSLTFVQKAILNIQDELQPTKPVITITNKLNNINDE